jgi:hypothetical protein
VSETARAETLRFFTELVKLTALVFVADVGAMGWLGIHWRTTLAPLGAWRWVMGVMVIAFAVMLLAAGGAWMYAAFKALRELRHPTP